MTKLKKPEALAAPAHPQDEPVTIQPTYAPRKICILGTTPSRMLAPFGDDSWEFWTIGPGGKDENRWDALFELHGPATWPPEFKQYIDDISHVKPETRLIGDRMVIKRVYTMQAMAGWVSNLAYPKEAITQKYRRMWMSSQISWALALAMEEGATEIGIFGVDLESGEEYEAQFEGCRHLMDMASLAGILLHVPPHCALLRDPDPYPDRWESVPALYVQSKIQYLEPMLSQKHGQMAQLQADIYRIEGELEFARHYTRMFVHRGSDRKIDLTSPWS